ncbi:MAG: ABC transporter substrate-binding protein [Burkholderiales bacterium]|nr:ABC transporter substrate-binding protein [Burkholderiales bacterium]
MSEDADPMRGRRAFLGAAGGAFAATLLCVLSLAPFARALAQQPPKLPTVAILSARAQTTDACGANLQASGLPCFMEALRDLGYVEGKNVLFEMRFAGDDFKRLPALAAELVRLRPDVIATHTVPGAYAAAAATTTIPIIVGPASEEALTRLSGNLARPTGNVTGFTVSSVEQEVKCLQFLKELAPRTARVVVLLNPDNPSHRNYPGILAPAAAQLGVTLTKVVARNAADLPQAFAAIMASGADAIYLVDDAALAGNGSVRRQVGEWALSRKLPLASSNARVAADGGLVSFGTDLNVLTRRAAAYVDKVLKGARPADLPVERPSKYNLSVNNKTARALGFAIPQSLLLRADEVIQ